MEPRASSPSAADRAIVHGLWGSRFSDPAVEERFLLWAFGRIRETALQFNYVTVVLLLIVSGVLLAIGPPLLVPLLAGVVAVLARRAVSRDGARARRHAGAAACALRRRRRASRGEPARTASTVRDRVPLLEGRPER